MEEDFDSVFDENGSINDEVKSCLKRGRVILHFDIDCFYAQVEMIKDPSLSCRPLGIKQKNIVVTSNYIARGRGVGKCCYINDALKICPDLVLVNGEDLADYRKTSQQIFDLIFRSVGGQCPVEKLGMDENFVDITGLVDDKMKEEIKNQSIIGYTFGHQAKASCATSNTKSITGTCQCHQRLIIGSQIAQEIRQKLFDELQITSSCGIAHNKLLAKLGGGKNKPNKQTVIFHETSKELMLTLKSLKEIPSLGSSTNDLLSQKGIKSILDLQATTVSQIKDVLSPENAQKLIDFSHGKDDSSVKLSGKPLSIGLEDRFKCINNKFECREKANWLLGRLAKLVLEDGRKPQTLKVFIRDFEKDKNDSKRKFAKYSRQCKVNPNSFKDEQSIVASHTGTLVDLVGKMVNFDQKFHLTLMGVAVTDFVSTDGKNRGIQAFLARNNIPECLPGSSDSQNVRESFFPTKISQDIDEQYRDKIFIKESQAESGNISKILQTKREKEPEDEEEEKLAPKKQKIVPEHWDLDVFDNLPDDIKEDVLSSHQNKSVETLRNNDTKLWPKKAHTSVNDDIPKDWDAQVFADLPQDLQNELLQNSKKNVTKKPQSASNSTILKYFHRK